MACALPKSLADTIKRILNKNLIFNLFIYGYFRFMADFRTASLPKLTCVADRALEGQFFDRAYSILNKSVQKKKKFKN